MPVVEPMAQFLAATAPLVKMSGEDALVLPETIVLSREMNAEPLIREMVHKKANWVLKLAGLDAKLADAIVDGLRKLTVEMSTDPTHPVRVKVEEALAQLANDLQTRADSLAGLGCASAAHGHRATQTAADRQCAKNILAIFGNHNAQRLDLVYAGVGGI